jgi:hypothetical protein
LCELELLMYNIYSTGIGCGFSPFHGKKFYIGARETNDFIAYSPPKWGETEANDQYSTLRISNGSKLTELDATFPWSIMLYPNYHNGNDTLIDPGYVTFNGNYFAWFYKNGISPGTKIYPRGQFDVNTNTFYHQSIKYDETKNNVYISFIKVHSVYVNTQYVVDLSYVLAKYDVGKGIYTFNKDVVPFDSKSNPQDTAASYMLTLATLPSSIACSSMIITSKSGQDKGKGAWWVKAYDANTLDLCWTYNLPTTSTGISQALYDHINQIYYVVATWQGPQDIEIVAFKVSASGLSFINRRPVSSWGGISYEPSTNLLLFEG